MRDDSKKWTPWSVADAQFETTNLTISAITLDCQTMVSGIGVLSAFHDEFGPATGWPDAARGPKYAIAVRRDRVLLVNGPSLTDGWHDDTGFAVSDMTGGFQAFDVAGAARYDIIKRGTSIDPKHPSASALRMFDGLGTIIYNMVDPDTVRIHVQSAHAAALFQLLCAHAGHL